MNIIHGDCLEELKKLEDNSIDAVVCDPPYGLSNTKPAQVADVLKAWVAGDTVSVPAKKGGFMGADWDSFVPPPAVWEECMRVLKPGGHMAVFAGARTQDLMGLSIRLAGFRIKDTLGWIFGSGFPKSHNPFKGLKLCPSIENAPHAVQVSEWHHHELSGAKEPTALALAEIMPGGEKALLIKTGKEESLQELTVMYLSDTTEETFSNIDLSWQKRSEESWKRMSMSIIKTIADQIIESKTLNFSPSKSTEECTLQKGIGEHGLNCRVARVVSFSGESDGSTSDTLMPTVVDAVTSPVFGMRSQGTQIKPAIEPIILAQKPLVGTVAANVLAHGVGGLNIDACRIETTETLGRAKAGWGSKAVGADDYGQFNSIGVTKEGGRFPANVLLDEHAAKEMDKQSGVSASIQRTGKRSGKSKDILGDFAGQENVTMGHNDSGGASRFFPVFKSEEETPEVKGRFPANVLLDECAAAEMDEQSGIVPSGGRTSARNAPKFSNGVYGQCSGGEEKTYTPDTGGASRYFPVFKYQAKAPKKERPVIYKNNCECEEWQSQLKDTTESTATAETSWNTSTSGNSTTEKCQQDTTSTTSTTTSSTTESKTSNALAGSTTSESTQDAKSETANGGNHAESAESLNQSEPNTGISAKRDGHSTDGAGHVISEKWYTTSNCEKCGEPRLKVQHATVKPLALMEWLVSLIVPPGGVVLDPFAGSGTTLQAALNKGFTPIGIEQDADYIKLIEKRLEGLCTTHKN